MPRPIYINGRFLTARFSGVQRTATELIRALDALLGSRATFAPEISVQLLHPPGIARPPILRNIAVKEIGAHAGQFWEQVELPRATRDGTLLNLCNIGPLFKRDAVTMFHDAQIYTAPQSYGLFFRLWYQIAQPIMGRVHRKILTVSHFSLNELASLNVVQKHKMSCIPNGCDHVVTSDLDFGVLDRFGLREGNYTVALSSTQSHKNIAVLLRAFQKPALRDHMLVLFGSATAADFSTLGYPLPPNLVVTGKITDAELGGLLRRATCFACPSLTEGFGLMPLEAMALGCPAVIAPCGALPEVCGSAASSADPLSPDDWADRINDLRDDPVLAADYRKRGLRRASLFSWNNSAKALLEILVDTHR